MPVSTAPLSTLAALNCPALLLGTRLSLPSAGTSAACTTILTQAGGHSEDAGPSSVLQRRSIMKTGSHPRLARATAAVLLLVACTCSANAQPAADPDVEQATFTRPSLGDVPEIVTFARHDAHKGDEAEQTIGLDLRMTMTMRQANEVVGKNQTTVRTNQKRLITTTAVDNGRAVAIRLQYPIATKQELILEGPAGEPPAAVSQPVQGKTYLCRREPGENGKLVITDEAGNRPPTDEYDIVDQQMQMVGRGNPLAQYLAGRQMTVGEKIELPTAVASQLFNLGDKFGKVSRFTLALERVEEEGGQPYAVFHANVDAVSAAATQMRLEVEGPLVVDIATCRAQKISLTGPIGMSETRGSYSTAYQIIGTGKLQMSIASAYRDAQR